MGLYYFENNKNQLKNFFFPNFEFLRKYMLVDACEAEEKVMQGLFSIGMNQHKELSTLAMFGEICLSREQVILSRLF